MTDIKVSKTDLPDDPKVTIPKGFALRKKVLMFDGFKYPTFEKVKVNEKLIHQKVLHYQRTTTCGLYANKRMKTAGDFKKVSCPDCLQFVADKKRKELQIIEDEIKFQRGKQNAKSAKT